MHCANVKYKVYLKIAQCSISPQKKEDLPPIKKYLSCINVYNWPFSTTTPFTRESPYTHKNCPSGKIYETKDCQSI